MFISSLLLVLELMHDAFGDSFKLLHAILVPFVILFCYGPVYGYGVWGTLWRFALCVVGAVNIIVVAALAVDVVRGRPPVSRFLVQNLAFLVIIVIATILASLFSRHAERRRKAKSYQ